MQRQTPGGIQACFTQSLCLDDGLQAEMLCMQRAYLRLQGLRVRRELGDAWLPHAMHLITGHLPHHFNDQPHGFQCYHPGRHCIPDWRADQASQPLQQTSLQVQSKN